jgi:hypothetical protein
MEISFAWAATQAVEHLIICIWTSGSNSCFQSVEGISGEVQKAGTFREDWLALPNKASNGNSVD